MIESRLLNWGEQNLPDLSILLFSIWALADMWTDLLKKNFKYPIENFEKIERSVFMRIQKD